MVLIDVESENGWRPADCQYHEDLLVWKTVPGTGVNIRVMKGLPEIFLPAWLADWNEYIEPLRDDDTASFTYGNKVYTSNHKNGTAADANWNSHPFEQRSFNDAQRATIHQMVVFYEGWMFWAGDWDDPIDEMHSQMGYNTWNRNTAALDFIARKIRSDGKSTFRRGPLSSTDPPKAGQDAGAPTPDMPDAPSRDNVTPTDSAVAVLYDAVPVIDMDCAEELLPLIQTGLEWAQCETVNEIAMYLAHNGHESDGFNTTEEYAKNGRYAPYIGRTWEQITWRENYAGFGKWCAEKGLLDDPDYFVNNPVRLADMKWASIGYAWYSLVARPTIPALAKAGNVLEVTKLINGGTNGLSDRQNRYNQAVALGDRLLLLLPKNNEDVIELPDTVTRAEWDEMVRDVKEIRAQLGGDGGWPQLGNRSVVDALSYVMRFMTSKKKPVNPPEAGKEPK